jgi:signal peptidase I
MVPLEENHAEGLAPDSQLLPPEHVSPEASPERAALPAKQRRRSSILEAAVLVLLALVLALSLKTYVAEAYEIKGRSMQPTFESGEKVVVLKLLYEIHRGDVIIFASRDDPSKDLIKRVVGLPGEEVRIEKGRVYIDGAVLTEEYLPQGASRLTEPSVRVKMGAREYFVLGDNRSDSHDSRKFFGVPLESVKGKVVVRWWPLDHFGSF